MVTEGFTWIKLAWLSLLLCLIFSSGGFSQNYLFELQSIGVEEGLPARMVYDIRQDSSGFIWISTKLGISRYDGYGFRTWHNEELDLAEQSPAHFTFDQFDRMWYWPKADGLTSHWKCLDPHNSIPYASKDLLGTNLESPEMFLVHESNMNTQEFIVGTQSGAFYTYDGMFKEILRIPDNPSGFRWMCRTLADGTYWFAYGLNFVKVSRDKAPEFFKISNALTRSNIVNQILMYAGCPVLEVRKNKKSRYVQLKEESFVPFTWPGIPSGEIKKIIHLHPDFIFYSDDEHLLIRDREGKILFSHATFARMGDRETVQINSPFLDRQNNLWIPTDNGLYMLTIRKNPFNVLAAGHSSYGLMKEENRLWRGGYPGFLMRNLETGKQIKLPLTYGIVSFCKDAEGNIWMGSNSRNIYLYRPESDSIEDFVFQEKNAMKLFFQNPVSGEYWVAPGFGLHAVNLNKQGPDGYRLGRSLLPNTGKQLIVWYFHTNSEGVWIATNQGLSSWTPPLKR